MCAICANIGRCNFSDDLTCFPRVVTVGIQTIQLSQHKLICQAKALIVSDKTSMPITSIPSTRVRTTGKHDTDFDPE